MFTLKQIETRCPFSDIWVFFLGLKPPTSSSLWIVVKPGDSSGLVLNKNFRKDLGRSQNSPLKGRSCFSRFLVGVHHKNRKLHGKINPKNWQVINLGDVGFLLFFRAVSDDYGKPCLCLLSRWCFGWISKPMGFNHHALQLSPPPPLGIIIFLFGSLHVPSASWKAHANLSLRSPMADSPSSLYTMEFYLHGAPALSWVSLESYHILWPLF